MRENYKKLGPYIREINIRNKDLTVERLLGVSIRKVLMPSIANTTGTKMHTYKIIKKMQFAYGPVTSRNGDKISIALMEDFDEAIVSQAYTVFEVADKNELDPEYLMMWFRRPEFDRYARYHSHGSARETFGWDDFCETELPIPSIEKQREIVAEYNTVQNRISLNEQLIQKLEETAQTIYRRWFVEFEFPDKDGKPYKSSGGEMVWCEELEKEVPLGWKNVHLSSIITIKDGTHDSPSPKEKGFPLVTSTHLNTYDISLKDTYNISEESFIQTNKRSKVDKYDILFSMIGTVGLVNYVLYDKINFAIKNVGLFKTSEQKEIAEYILFYLKSDYMKIYLASNPNGSTQNYVTLGFLRDMPILLPMDKTILKFEETSKKVIETIHLKTQENQKLTELKELLLSRMTKIEKS
ncbi:MAG: restriction endonuclease subunit S [Brumimicrobium sp.]